MRTLLRKSSSTKAERIFYEILKKNHIPFRHRVVIDGHEIDFIVGQYAIEIDGHEQSTHRNDWLFKLDLIPIHYHNRALQNSRSVVEKDITSKYGLSYKRDTPTRFVRKSV